MTTVTIPTTTVAVADSGVDVALTIGAASTTVTATGGVGPANSLAIGSVTAGSAAAATITGTPPSQTLSLTLPGAAWGNITGTLSNQTDLNSALAGKVAFNYLDTPASGEFSTPRSYLNEVAATASGTMLLSFKRATKTETITRISLTTATVAAGATPSLCRMGVYSVNESTNEITLIASIANDTTLFAATGTTYTRNLSASYTKTAGVLYAYAVLVVTSAALPTYIGIMNSNITGMATFTSQSPPMCAQVTGQTDLPATHTLVSGNNGVRNPLFWARPA